MRFDLVFSRISRLCEIWRVSHRRFCLFPFARNKSRIFHTKRNRSCLWLIFSYWDVCWYFLEFLLCVKYGEFHTDKFASLLLLVTNLAYFTRREIGRVSDSSFSVLVSGAEFHTKRNWIFIPGLSFFFTGYDIGLFRHRIGEKGK